MKIIQKVRQKIGFATATDLRALKSEIDEIYWGQKFSLLTRDSKWFSSGIYAGGWAVGYPFLCILYRILNEIKPKAILELGLGQSTKLTSAYVNSNIDVRGGGVHCICEHDSDWIAFMNNSLNLNNSKICQLELEERNFMNFNVTTYKKFKENIPNKKYDLILIDAPFGSDRFSRIDTLAIIPELLSDNFIIMLDDYERQGERDTGKLIFEKLNSFRVKYAHCIYKGAKETLVIASENLKFVCSMY